MSSIPPRASRHFTSVLSRVMACVLAVLGSSASGSVVPIGAARVDISPTSPVPLMGYASRASLPRSAEVAQRIHARALAIGADEEVALLFTIDNCILPAPVAAQIRRRLVEKLKVRPERIAFTVTHTHSAPCLAGAAPNIFGTDFSDEDQAAIERYTQSFIGHLEKVAADALAAREPAKLAWGQGAVSFAKNRRAQGGPVDHAMPLLRVTSPSGEVRAIFVNYACHCTTLGGDFNAVHGDWAGVAAERMERDYPGAIALVAIGCGADANPEPRGKVELAVQHGEAIVSEARRLIAEKLTDLAGPPDCRIKSIDLPFQTHFTREEWKARAEQKGVVGYHARKWLARFDEGEALPSKLSYPVQTWSFRERLGMVFLGGEVVVDYAVRLKKEFDAERLWVNAYSNEVPCYIPSRRILAEGGYEAEDSLWYYDQPQRLAPAVEDLIVDTVRELLPSGFHAGAASPAVAQ